MGGSGSMMVEGLGSSMIPGAAPRMATTTVATPPGWPAVVTTGHSLFTLAFAFMGGAVARVWYRRLKPSTRHPIWGRH